MGIESTVYGRGLPERARNFTIKNRRTSFLETNQNSVLVYGADNTLTKADEKTLEAREIFFRAIQTGHVESLTPDQFRTLNARYGTEPNRILSFGILELMWGFEVSRAAFHDRHKRAINQLMRLESKSMPESPTQSELKTRVQRERIETAKNRGHFQLLPPDQQGALETRYPSNGRGTLEDCAAAGFGRNAQGAFSLTTTGFNNLERLQAGQRIRNPKTDLEKLAILLRSPDPNMAEIAQMLGVSTPTIYKWKKKIDGAPQEEKVPK